MTDYFIDSNASGANNGTSWANAWDSGSQTDWSNASTTATAAGDIIYVASDNLSSLTGNITFVVNSNHTRENPLRIIAATTGDTLPIANYGTSGNGEVSSIGLFYAISFNGNVVLQCLRFLAEETFIGSHNVTEVTYIRCFVEIERSQPDTITMFGDCVLSFIETDLSFKAGAISLRLQEDGATFLMRGGSVTTDSSATTAFCITVSGLRSTKAEFIGVDFTGLHANTPLTGLNGAGDLCIRSFINCKWPAIMPTVYASAATNIRRGSEILISAEKGLVRGQFEHGNFLDETTIRMAGGANNGTDDYSLKIESTSTATDATPMRIVLNVQNPGDLDTLTLKVHFANDKGALTNKQIWIESYTTTSTGISSNTDRNLLEGTSAEHNDESGNVDWRDDASDLDTPTTFNEQSCSVTVSGATTGLLYVVLCVADNFTDTDSLYVNPKVVIA